MTQENRSEASPSLWLISLFVCWAILCIPLCLVDIPPLSDYPNHLARMHILSVIDTDTRMQTFFLKHWSIIPDLAIDSFLPWLITIIPPTVAGRLVLSAVFFFDVFGVAVLSRALHQRRTWWSLGVVFAAYNLAFMMGFFNFSFSAGLAMPLAAMWIHLRRQSLIKSAGFGFLCASILFFCHLMGLFYFSMLLASFELSLMWERAKSGNWSAKSIWSAALSGWPAYVAALPPAILYPISELNQADGYNSWLPWHDRLIQAMSPVINFDFTLDAVTASLVILTLIVCASFRGLRIAPGSVFAMAIIGGLYPILPHDIKGTGFVDTRLAVMLGFLIFVSFDIRPGKRLGRFLACMFAILFVVRISVVADGWLNWRQDLVNMENLSKLVDVDDQVVQIDVEPEEIPNYGLVAPAGWALSNGQKTNYHIAAWYFTIRGVWWPYIFSNASQQPLLTQPKYLKIGAEIDNLPGHADVIEMRHKIINRGRNPFCPFDKLLLMAAWADPDTDKFAPDWLELISRNRTAALYRVVGCQKTH